MKYVPEMGHPVATAEFDLLYFRQGQAARNLL
jgi:hypothetical protein